MGDEQAAVEPADKPEKSACTLTVGGYARDDGGRVGVVMEVWPNSVYLRPQGGGREWVRPADKVAPITTGDALRVRVAEERRKRQQGRAR
ncbi:hypothetical protein RKE29_27850 [Streptomyces sp. B1866]|uniref:hypothetical protein n=1 Tax=Streptomyces sp. B1866 TaxID=3075431 RepID=UPI0028914BFF|nr:hypothetical protein [Streptomyces sp. B1866]MDT3400379.1 hypothetical protein [Streptomyces sp. B1866]